MFSVIEANNEQLKLLPKFFEEKLGDDLAEDMMFKELAYPTYIRNMPLPILGIASWPADEVLSVTIRDTTYNCDITVPVIMPKKGQFIAVINDEQLPIVFPVISLNYMVAKLKSKGLNPNNIDSFLAFINHTNRVAQHLADMGVVSIPFVTLDPASITLRTLLDVRVWVSAYFVHTTPFFLQEMIVMDGSSSIRGKLVKTTLRVISFFVEKFSGKRTVLMVALSKDAEQQRQILVEALHKLALRSVRDGRVQFLPSGISKALLPPQ